MPSFPLYILSLLHQAEKKDTIKYRVHPVKYNNNTNYKLINLIQSFFQPQYINFEIINHINSHREDGSTYILSVVHDIKKKLCCLIQSTHNTFYFRSITEMVQI